MKYLMSYVIGQNISNSTMLAGAGKFVDDVTKLGSGAMSGNLDKAAKDIDFQLKYQNKIIGVTCHNSKRLIKKAIKNKADYIAIGAFFPSKTKKTKFKANLSLLKYTKKITKRAIFSIGG